MKSRFTILLFFGIFSFLHQARASHVLGGEFRLSPAGGSDRYTLSMIIFWDESLLNFTNRNPYVDVNIYRKRDNRLMRTTRLNSVSSRQITYPNQDCAGSRISTLEETFGSDIELNPGDYNDSDGYYVVWERCCRGASVSNISDPGSTGLVFYLEFPPLSVRNTSPVFNSPNGDYICRGLPYSMNVAASDADGDELRYSLVTPTRGNTTFAAPLGDNTPKAGYPLVQLAPGITPQNLIPGNPALSIDARTGELTVVANQLGLFVFTVQCEEFRNGKRIGVTRRDFQSLVVECKPQTPPEPTILYNGQPVPNIQQCDSSAVTLEVADAGDYNYQWQFNAQNIPGANQATLVANKNGAYTVRRSLKTPGNCSQPSQSPILYLVQGRKPDATIRKTNPAVCEGKKIDLVADRNEDYSYEWRRDGALLGERSSILAVTEAGKYRIDIKNNSNGCTASDTLRVVSESVKVTLPATVSIPRGGRAVLDPQITTSSSPLKYRWSPPVGLSDSTAKNPTAAPVKTTAYTLRVETPGGCSASASIEVIALDCAPIMPPKPTLFSGNIPAKAVLYACGDDSLVLTVPADTAYRYQWLRNGNLLSGATDNSIAVRDTGSYRLMLSYRTTDPCKTSILSDATRLFRVAAPQAIITPSATRLCVGDSVKLSATSGSDAAFQWTGPDNVVLSDEPILSVDTGGKYVLRTTDTETGCIGYDSSTVSEETLVLKLPKTTRIQNGQSVELRPTVETNASAVEFAWSPPADLSNPADSVPVASPRQTTTYILRIKSSAGCTAQDSIKVVVSDQLFIPDAFSPNGDGMNDSFVIQDGNKLIKTVRIYNRWGEVVFDAAGYDTPWDGRMGNERVPNGVYAYIVTTDKDVYKGTVLLMY